SDLYLTQHAQRGLRSIRQLRRVVREAGQLRAREAHGGRAGLLAGAQREPQGLLGGGTGTGGPADPDDARLVTHAASPSRSRYAMRSAIVIRRSPWILATPMRSGRRAMVPSAAMISQMTPAGSRPAIRARSMAASVFP